MTLKVTLEMTLEMKSQVELASMLGRSLGDVVPEANMPTRCRCECEIDQDSDGETPFGHRISGRIGNGSLAFDPDTRSRREWILVHVSRVSMNWALG
jgi:hypothetical protein